MESDTLFPIDQIETSLGAPWLKAFRSNAAEKLRDATLPSTSEEIWRYSRVDEIDLSTYKLAQSDGKLADTDLKKQIDVLAHDIGAGNVQLVMVDGVWSPELSSSLDVVQKTGVRIVTLADCADEVPVVSERDDVFIVANDAFAQGLVIDVPEKVQLETPLLIVHVITQSDAISFPRTVIRVGNSAALQVVECFISASVSALTIPVAEIEVGESAQLHHVVIQNVAGTVSCIARQTSRLQRNATLSSANLVFGGDFARVRNDTELLGEGSTSNLSAVYFGENNQMHDFRTLQEHIGAHSTSDLFFRGAVADKAHAVYSGLIRIRKGAHGTNAMQSNRTLKLSPEAIADSVPNLEIDENDVRCAHASAVGPIGEEERYYLESRGIPTAEAERLIVLGFLDQVFVRVPIDGVVNYAREVLREKWEAHS